MSAAPAPAPDGAARGFTVRGLGEIALRCRDRAAMERFYGETLGLALLDRRPGGITFFALAPGWDGHTQVLALFEAERGGPGPHHLALSVDWAAQNAAVDWLRAAGLPARVQDFDWIGWRGVFTEDPEGNTVELVAARPRTT